MRNFFALVISLTLLVIIVSSKSCSEKNLEKRVKAYTKKCLDKAFKSSLGCKSAMDGMVNKKTKRKCGKMEKGLKKCGYTCQKKTDGGWGDFGDWSACSAACGGGTQKRSRSCNNPAPAHGGADCVGDKDQVQKCGEKPCPINGGWGDFGGWSACSAACGGGTQKRSRSCSKPAPANGGADCVGDKEQVQDCNTEACKPYTLKIACDDDMTVYIDGVQKHADKNWQTIASLSVPASTKVIAVKCYNGGGGRGIVGGMKDAAGKDVMVTDSSWKCSGAGGEGWEATDFNAAAWKQPEDLGDGHFMRKNSPFTQITSPARRSIWSSGGGGDATAYCRVELN